VTEPVTPSIGWAVVHLFCKPTPVTDAEAIVAAVKDAQSQDHLVLTAAILGHKADLCVMGLGPDLRVLRQLQTGLQRAGLEVVDSYVSLTEVSEYAKGMPQEMLDLRLYPPLPVEGKKAFCFYPMSKRRDTGQNWFTLPYDDRERLMREHGASGRKFAGRITQLVTGSAGFDDYEWGVTLFGQKPDDLKEVVYTMRFDEASAVYAEFGPFYVGYLVDLEELVTPYR
jgi:hydrogen peroxide-dependent heme synthase